MIVSHANNCVTYQIKLFLNLESTVELNFVFETMQKNCVSIDSQPTYLVSISPLIFIGISKRNNPNKKVLNCVQIRNLIILIKKKPCECDCKFATSQLNAMVKLKLDIKSAR